MNFPPTDTSSAPVVNSNPPSSKGAELQQDFLSPEGQTIITISVKKNNASEAVGLRAAPCPTLSDTSRITAQAIRKLSLERHPLLRHSIPVVNDPHSSSGEQSPVCFVILYIQLGTKLEALNLQVQDGEAEVDVFLSQKLLERIARDRDLPLTLTLGVDTDRVPPPQAPLVTTPRRAKSLESLGSLEVNAPHSTSSDDNHMPADFVEVVRATSNIATAKPLVGTGLPYSHSSDEQSQYSLTGSWITSDTETAMSTGGFLDGILGGNKTIKKTE